MPSIDSLVSASWLEEHLGDEDLRIMDATVQITPEFQVTSGQPGWERAHIPGAVLADLLELSDPAVPAVTFTMPSADWFAARLGRLGIGDGTRVVIYDARENMWAARLWWMLRAFGFDAAGVLDGGWKTWQLEQRRTCSVPCVYPPTTFEARPRSGLFVGKEEVMAALGDRSTCLVSALGRRSHRGEISEYGRPGHIPGAKLDAHRSRDAAIPATR